MHGAEYDELVETIDNYKDKFETVTVAEPMLGEVGSDATVVNEDKAKVAEAITAEAVKTAGYDSLDAAKRRWYSIRIYGTWNFSFCKGKLQPDGSTDERSFL